MLAVSVARIIKMYQILPSCSQWFWRRLLVCFISNWLSQLLVLFCVCFQVRGSGCSSCPGRRLSRLPVPARCKCHFCRMLLKHARMLYPGLHVWPFLKSSQKAEYVKWKSVQQQETGGGSYAPTNTIFLCKHAFTVSHALKQRVNTKEYISLVLITLITARSRHNKSLCLWLFLHISDNMKLSLQLPFDKNRFSATNQKT